MVTLEHFKDTYAEFVDFVGTGLCTKSKIIEFLEKKGFSIKLNDSEYSYIKLDLLTGASAEYKDKYGSVYMLNGNSKVFIDLEDLFLKCFEFLEN